MHRLTLAAVTAFASFMPAAAQSGELGWSCRNMEYEISCNGGVCEASEAFTPMDIYTNSEEMAACAYTGCWEGKPTVIQSGRFIIFLGTDLPFSTQPEGRGDIALTIDTETHSATILVGDLYAMPAVCKRWSAPEQD